MGGWQFRLRCTDISYTQKYEILNDNMVLIKHNFYPSNLSENLDKSSVFLGDKLR